MSVFWRLSRQVEVDRNGRPMPGAKAFFFAAGTTTPATVYQDSTLSMPHTHPVVASGVGRWPAVFMAYGAYRERVTTANEETLWDDDNIVFDAPVEGGGSSSSGFETGDELWAHRIDTKDGWVRQNGRSIGSASSSATERANADCQALFTFLWTRDTNLAVSGGRGASAASDWAANKRIDLPDMRQKASTGLSGMGNASLPGLSNVLGTTGGAPTVTLSQGNLPNARVGNTSLSYDRPSATINVNSVSSGGTAVFRDSLQSVSLNHDHPFNGSGTAVNVMGPYLQKTCYIKL